MVGWLGSRVFFISSDSDIYWSFQLNLYKARQIPLDTVHMGSSAVGRQGTDRLGQAAAAGSQRL